MEYDAGRQDVELMLKEPKIELVAPRAREEGTAKEGDKKMKDTYETSSDKRRSAYRAFVARANYLARDRPDIAFSAKEFARCVAAPTVGDWERLKRPARYSKRRPRIVKKCKCKRTH